MKFTCFVVITLIVFQSFAFAQREGSAQRNLLVNEVNRLGGLSEILITDHSWTGVPNYYDRSFWEGLPEVMRQEYIQSAEAYLDYDWPAAIATNYLEIIRTGRRVGGSPARSVLTTLVRGELMEGEGRFIDQIVNGVWFLCEQTWWGASAHLYRGKATEGLPDPEEHIVDLPVVATANTLSWTHYFFKDEFNNIHPLIAQRLKDEVMRKAINPYLEHDLFYWWWMGFEDEFGIHHVNNWVPNTHYNLLTAILLLVDEPERKIEGVQKILRGLDVFINSYPDDGGTDEGPSYWGGAIGNLYKSLVLLEKATDRKLNLFGHSIIQNMGKFIYRVHIADSYFLNFSDADLRTGDGRGLLLYNFGKSINDPTMQKFGALRVQNSNWGQTTGGSFDEGLQESAFNEVFKKEILSAPAGDPLLGSFWLPQTGIGGARDKAGTTEGFYFAAKGGTNAESHNHNDVGSFMLYVNGKPCLIDVGRDTYVAQTFREGRYEIWNMQSQYHNLPKINGIDQVAGNQYRAQNTDFSDDGQIAVFSTEIAAAYPHEAGVNSWVRSYTLNRGREFAVTDLYRLEKVKEASTTLNFMTSSKVSLTGPGILILEGDEFTVQMEYDATRASAKIEVLDLDKISNRLGRTWTEGLSRIVLKLNDTGLKGSFKTVFTRIY